MQTERQRRFKFTPIALAALPHPERGQISYTDTESTGLQLRVGPRTKTWYAVGSVKRDGGWRAYRQPLGRFPDLGLKEARVKKAEVAATISTGLPIAKAQRAHVAFTTFAAARTQFLAAKQSQLRGKTHDEYKRILEGLAPWDQRDVQSIDRREVHALLRQIESTKSHVVAHKTFTFLRAMFNWCMRHLIIDAAPTDRVAAPDKPSKRNRVLSDDEIGILGRTLLGMQPASDRYVERGALFVPVVLLLLLTGQRREEIGALRSDELRLDGTQVELAGTRTKNALPHLVPLSPFAMRVLDMVPKVDDSLYVFTTTGDTPLSGYSKAKLNLDHAIRAQLAAETAATSSDATRDRLAKAFATPWRLHDLRRTLVTGMNNLGVAPHIVEAIVNHVSGPAKAGVAGVYNHALYLAERRAALDLWAAHVEKLIGRKVI